MYRSFHADDASSFEEWLELVFRIEVDLYPGGRAVLFHPATSLPVEVRWTSPDEISSFRVDAAPGGHIPWGPMPPMSAYLAALRLAVAEGREVATEPEPETGPGEGSATLRTRGRLRATGRVDPRPQPGQRPSIEFYRRLVSEYNQLVRDAHRAPIPELSRRYGAKEGTVKSWLSRGREYLKRESGTG